MDRTVRRSATRPAARSSGVAARSSGVAARSSGVTARSSGVTARSSGVTARSSGVPEVELSGPPHVQAPGHPGLVSRLRGAINIVYREVAKFGAVGAVAFVVDLYVYNLLRVGVWPLDQAPLDHKPVLSKVISVAVATMVAWLGNRYWTFRHRRRAAIRREFVLFVVMNVGGLLIAVSCLGLSHYVLGLTSALADNISGNVVGLALGTLFRFWAYRQLVFTELRDQAPAATLSEER